MERLTRKVCGGWGIAPGYELDTLKGARTVVERLAAYEETGLTPEEIAELAEAKRDERLVVLPCKLSPAPNGNNLVYFIDDGKLYDDTPYEAIVGFNSGEGEISVSISCAENGLDFEESDIGKTVFLTEEEAEKALKERKP